MVLIGLMIFLIVQGQINHQLIYELQRVAMPLNNFNFQKITLRKNTQICWVDKFYGRIIIVLKLLFKIQMLQKVKIIQGNLDPTYLLSNNQEVLYEQIMKIKKGFKKPFVFNLGHGILPSTPLENVQFLVDTVRRN